ncbi:hypothetical protein KCP74_20090 [Salmonella enterica subsp. enterica]|nr:hypothetical protein KCP74_20090 [Salmonella enterica subsp. enterica]
MNATSNRIPIRCSGDLRPDGGIKPPLINARVEAAAYQHRCLNCYGNMAELSCFADGWFEWKKEGDKKYIHRWRPANIHGGDVAAYRSNAVMMPKRFRLSPLQPIKVW